MTHSKFSAARTYTQGRNFSCAQLDMFREPGAETPERSAGRQAFLDLTRPPALAPCPSARERCRILPTYAYLVGRAASRAVYLVGTEDAMCSRGALLVFCVCLGSAGAQFGNANINWNVDKEPAVVVNNEEPLREVKTPHGTRKTGLYTLSMEELKVVMDGFGLEPRGTTPGHMISQIRGACLGLAPKGLKAQLAKRGLRCEGCQHREAFLDKLLDSVHLPLKKRK